MKTYISLIATIFLTLMGCNNTENNKDMEKWISEIRNVEKAFNDMAQEQNISKAFEYYAAEDAVIKRNEKIIKGKKAIKAWYEKNGNPNQSLTWEPTFINVSNSGDMAYTYGNYMLTYIDSSGIRKESTGIFHTVWKRQSDGTWRFVWD